MKTGISLRTFRKKYPMFKIGPDGKKVKTPYKILLEESASAKTKQERNAAGRRFMEAATKEILAKF